jgi:phosphoadenosine phosphosulfate reductase
MPLWKDRCFVEDEWHIVDDASPIPDGEKAIVSLKRWRDERATLAERNAPLGLLIAPGSPWTDVVADLPRFPVIVVTIPKYADGRAFSIARLLRERDHYEGEIRAVGNYIVDQMPLMRRVGIDAFVVDDPILIGQLEKGEWPEVTDYLQPAIDTAAEVPAGTRPWARKKNAGPTDPKGR